MNSIQKGDFAVLLYRGEGSVRIEEEVRFPDYCPDIVRLVRVEATPVFEKSRAALQDNTLTIEVSGRAEFTAIYSDESGVCQPYSFSCDFSHSMKKEIAKSTPVIPDSIFTFVTPTAGKSFPKVLSPDKLLARLEIDFLGEVYANLEYSAYNASEDVSEHRADAEVRERTVSRIVNSKSESFTVSQEIKLPATLPAGAKLLSCTASVMPESHHPSADSVSVFSNVNFNVFYLSEETGERGGELISFYQPVEVRDVIECDDCAEDSVCRIRAVAGRAECTILPDSFGEMRIFSLTLPYTLSCLVMENTEADFVSDLYGIDAEAECEYESKEFSEYIGSLSEAQSFREKIALKSDAGEVRGANGIAVLKGAGVNSDGAFADVEIMVSAIIEEEGGIFKNVEDAFTTRLVLSVPESITSKFSPETLACDASVFCSFVSAQVSGAALEVSGEVATSAQLWRKNSVKYMTGVSFNKRESAPRKTVFYYPSGEDTLWSVGRRYGVERQRLREANGMDSDTLPEVCIIPR